MSKDILNHSSYIYENVIVSSCILLLMLVKDQKHMVTCYQVYFNKILKNTKHVLKLYYENRKDTVLLMTYIICIDVGYKNDNNS